MITDEMVEAAAVGMSSFPGIYYVPQVSYDSLYDKLARAALEAVEPLIRQQTAEAIAAAIEDAGDAQADFSGPAPGYYAAAKRAREYGKGDPK